MRGRSCLTALVLGAALAAGCGDDHSPPHGPDGGVDAMPDGGVDAMPDAPIDAMPDAPIDAPPADAPRLTGLITPYAGGNDLRQSDLTTVVVSGAFLTGATRLTIGGAAATITGITATRMSAYFDTPAGYPPGPADVVVTTPRGSATLPGGADITPFVVAPDVGQGRGTFDSPISFCDPQLLEARPGDTIALLGGTHCMAQATLPDGIIIEGAADGSSVFAGGGQLSFGGSTATTTILRRFKIEGENLGPTIGFENPAGHLVVQDVTDGGGLYVAAASTTVERYTFTGRPGALAALYLVAGQTQVRDARIEGSALGIELLGGSLSLRRSVVRGESDAALRLSAAAAAVDLGTAVSPGGNALSVGSGVALDDARAAPSPAQGTISAVGTTLNGTSYAGQRIPGPATHLPDYCLRSSDAALQF